MDLQPGLAPKPDLPDGWRGLEPSEEAVKGAQTPGGNRLLLHLWLFLATVVTTIIAGALIATGVFFPDNLIILYLNPGLIYKGIAFSFTLIIILFSHEMGHYLISRLHRLDVSLPYFIPAPPPFIIGTFGAFIRIRSPIQDKRALLDVGCSGPLIGVLAAIPVLVVGLKLSTIKQIPGGGLGLILGEPLLFQIVSHLTLGPLGPDTHIIMHPVAFAGWIGLLVTALNLFPVGQLDGGHVAYALFPEHHRRISLTCLLLLVVCGLMFWQGWLIWALVLYFLGFRHPPPHHYWVPLDGRRRLLGFVTILVFVLTFTPSPFRLG
jgi:membrane-associated protease RseP (regulator of RpoE activity)